MTANNEQVEFYYQNIYVGIFQKFLSLPIFLSFSLSFYPE